MGTQAATVRLPATDFDDTTNDDDGKAFVAKFETPSDVVARKLWKSWTSDFM